MKHDQDASIQRREGTFRSSPRGNSSAEIFYQTWSSSPATPARATLVLTHGMAEHSECYAKTAEQLVPRGYNVIAWDLRGHGRSSGKRGYVEDFRCFSLDLAELLKHLSASLAEKPFALVGHSMGGLISLRHIIDEDDTKSAAVPKAKVLALSSPLLGLALDVPVVKDFAARILRRVVPQLTMYNELRYDDLNRDPAWVKTYETDALRHDKISPSLYLGMLDNMAYVNARAERVLLPTLVQAAGMDKIVSLPATKNLFEKLASPEKKLIVYPESYHEIYNDLDRLQVFQDLDLYLKDHLVPGASR